MDGLPRPATALPADACPQDSGQSTTPPSRWHRIPRGTGSLPEKTEPSVEDGQCPRPGQLRRGRTQPAATRRGPGANTTTRCCSRRSSLRGEQHWGALCGQSASLGGETTDGGEGRRAPPTSRTLREDTVSQTWPLGGTRASREGEEGREASGPWRCSAYRGHRHQVPGTQDRRDPGQRAKPSPSHSCMHACPRGPHHLAALLGGQTRRARGTPGTQAASGPREEILGPRTLCRDALASVLREKQLPEAGGPRPTPRSGEVLPSGAPRRLWTVCSDTKQSSRK